MDAFDWGKIKNGFSGFEKLAVRFVNDQFSVSRPWTQTKKTRDGNRDAYTIVLGYQAYPAKEEQWWMEAKYSTAVQKLTRYKLDATIVSAILNGNVSKVIFVTNILVGAKTVQDIRTALKKAVNCKDVSFCTKYTLEFWLRQNPEVLLEFFEGTAFRFNFPDLFITEEPEFYSKIDRGLTFREPLHILQRNQQYSACFSVFSAKKCVRKIRTKKDIQGLTLLSRAQLSLHPGENHICISFRLERDYKGGNGTNEHSAPVFLLGDAQLLPKYAEVVDGTEITIRIKSQEQIREEIDTLFTEFQRRNQLFLYCIRGVSGSGKSSLIDEVLYRNVRIALGFKETDKGECDGIDNVKMLSKVINVSQEPIGRTPRSNPATYIKVFDDIRDVFASTPDAKIRGMGKSMFSFNMPGGRCEACQGAGVKRISMNFLPDVYVTCDVCNGKRYTDDVLQIRYKGKNIADVLEMTAEEALDFFSANPQIRRKLKTLVDVGLGYMKLGQSSTTISGGEAQRVKLAYELEKVSDGRTLYILDEPTTGLHPYDISKLIAVLDRLVDSGNSVVVIEHNLDVIKCADWIIDLGPEGGDRGGTLLFEGRPEDIINCEKSYTGQYLRRELEKEKYRRQSQEEK